MPTFSLLGWQKFDWVLDSVLHFLFNHLENANSQAVYQINLKYRWRALLFSNCFSFICSDKTLYDYLLVLTWSACVVSQYMYMLSLEVKDLWKWNRLLLNLTWRNSEMENISLEQDGAFQQSRLQVISPFLKSQSLVNGHFQYFNLIQISFGESQHPLSA